VSLLSRTMKAALLISSMSQGRGKRRCFYYSRETLCSRGKLNRQCHPCLTTLASRNSSTPPGPEVGSQGVVRRAVSRDRKYGEHRCRTAPSVSAVSQCFDRSARRSECRLVGLVSDLPRRPTFLPREGKAASHSMSAVGDPSARGAGQRVPTWQSCSVSRQMAVPRG
jgi:hypothetical protein